MRVTAIFIALINLAVLGGLGEDGAPFRAGSASWPVALAGVLVAVVAGSMVSEVVLKRLRPAVLAEKFSDRYANLVVVMGLGGALMGWFPDRRADRRHARRQWGAKRVGLPVPLATLPMYLLGAGSGLGLGLLEGPFITLPLAAILGRFGDGV